MTVPALLGLDIGSSSLKALLLSPQGLPLGEASAPYPTHSPFPGAAEQDPQAWWRAAGTATRAVLEAGGPVQVIGIGLSGQMHTFVLVDAHGEPVRPAITWMDTRAAGLLPDLAERIDAAGLRDELANPVVVGLTLPPLRWLQLHERDAIAAARSLLSAKDWLRYRLTRAIGSEPTDASATLLFDVGRRRWSHATCDAFGLDPAILPPLGDPMAAAGVLAADAAAHLGLRAGIPVAFGAGDAQAAALGMGSVAAGDAQLMVGTGAQPSVVLGEAPAGDPGNGLHAFCHLRGWLLQASVNNAGSALGWARDLLGLDWDALYGALGDEVPQAPLFLPYLTGERAGLAKGYARGGWLGLEPAHARSDLAAAAVAGVVAGIATGIEIVLSDVVTSTIRSAGGGLRNAGFAQAVADATGRRLEVRDAGAASAVGAALLGGVAGGIFDDLDSAAARAPHTVAALVEPRPGRMAAWTALRERLHTLDVVGLHEVVRG